MRVQPSFNARMEFLRWLARHDPLVFRTAVKVAEKQGVKVEGLGSFVPDNTGMALPGTVTPTSGGSTSTVDAIVAAVEKVIPALATAYSTDRVLKAQLELAKMGQPPLQTAQYAPTMRHEVAVSEEGERAASRIASNVVGEAIGKIWPALLIAAVGAFMFLRK